jgi:hypothetical protein
MLGWKFAKFRLWILRVFDDPDGNEFEVMWRVPREAWGEDEAKVESWLSTAARVPGFIGFAVGRTTFWDALVGWRDGRTTREAASAEVARRYTRWCKLFVQRAEGR